MDRKVFIEKMAAYGDAVVTYRSVNSKKLKYNVCTPDFDNEYIQSRRNSVKVNKDCVLLFCWDTNSYRQINPKAVTSIQPLATILRNNRRRH
jgi:hypothetical protein